MLRLKICTACKIAYKKPKTKIFIYKKLIYSKRKIWDLWQKEQTNKERGSSKYSFVQLIKIHRFCCCCFLINQNKTNQEEEIHYKKKTGKEDQKYFQEFLEHEKMG